MSWRLAKVRSKICLATIVKVWEGKKPESIEKEGVGFSDMVN